MIAARSKEEAWRRANISHSNGKLQQTKAMEIDPLFNDFDIHIIDMSDEVLCDLCNKSYKGLPDRGGIIFESKAICPDCTPDIMESIEEHNEQKFIRATCPDNVTFYSFVINYRNQQA